MDKIKNSTFMELPIEKVLLDEDNPRIQRYLQMYGKNGVTSEGIALALNDSGDSSGNSYDTLKESIKVSKGIIHPILVNHTETDNYVVIEGNTRLQIYKEFKELDPSGIWDNIKCIVYENLSMAEIDGIRLQSHLVGPRDWDAYSKAKYLNKLSNVDYLPMTAIVSYCGGTARVSEINRLINAYNDMEKYYRPIVVGSGQNVNPRDFSYFSELQNKNLLQILSEQGFNKHDFSQWVFDDRIRTAQDVRQLKYILPNKLAREKFLKSNTAEAMKMLNVDKKVEPTELSLYELAKELKAKILSISWADIKLLTQGDGEYGEQKDELIDLKEELDELIASIIGE